MYRGTVAGLYNTLYYMGSILATFTVYGANLHLSGNIVWRLPLWLQMVCPGFVALFVWFLPESPRWLVGTFISPFHKHIVLLYFIWTPTSNNSHYPQLRNVTMKPATS